MQLNDLNGTHIGRKVRFGGREGFLVRILHEQNQQPYVRLLSPDLLNSASERFDGDIEVELLPEVEIIEADPDNELVDPGSPATV